MRIPKVGDVVEVVLEDRRVVNGLVTVYWGTTDGDGTACMNVVFVSADVDKKDDYGRQIQRYSSCSSEQQASTMTHPGRYWRWPKQPDPTLIPEGRELANKGELKSLYAAIDSYRGGDRQKAEDIMSGKVTL